MRRSIPLLRGAKGHGWYHKFMEKGAQLITGSIITNDLLLLIIFIALFVSDTFLPIL